MAQSLRPRLLRRPHTKNESVLSPCVREGRTFPVPHHARRRTEVPQWTICSGGNDTKAGDPRLGDAKRKNAIKEIRNERYCCFSGDGGLSWIGCLWAGFDGHCHARREGISVFSRQPSRAVQPQHASTIWGPVRWSVACGRMVCSGMFSRLGGRCKGLGARLRCLLRYRYLKVEVHGDVTPTDGETGGMEGCDLGERDMECLEGKGERGESHGDGCGR